MAGRSQCLFALLVAAWALRLEAQVDSTVDAGPDGDAGRYFGIEIVDSETGRGVPLIELATTFGARYVSDSAGRIAFFEPGLMDREIWFEVSGHGYRYPADGFGFRGLRLTPTAGGRARLSVERRNLAERLYRITGVGIYRDSRLLGEAVPLTRPLINAEVSGQDSALAHLYKGRLYWFWGDTGRLSYPLGLFKAAGATSRLPGDGGLPPAQGIDFDYFTGSDGFARNVAPIDGDGVVWLDGLHSAPDADGQLRLFARYERRNGLAEVYEAGVAVWNESTQRFDKAAEFAPGDPRHPVGRQPIVQMRDDGEYLVFTSPFPTLRVPRRLDAVLDPEQYEAFTPLVAGTRYAGADSELERAADGSLVWAWKRDAAPLAAAEQAELLRLGRMRRDESPFRLVEAASGEPVEAHSGTIAWNDYLDAWLMVFGRFDGRDSLLGEVMVATADALEGPWTDARTVVSHDAYSFYNVAQRPFFDENGGRLVYFEGTYSQTFSASPTGTPYYDYNQLMYRLDLAAAFGDTGR